MKFPDEFDLKLPNGRSLSETETRRNSEAAAAATLVRQGHLVRLWRQPAAPGETEALGPCRADSGAQLDGLATSCPREPRPRCENDSPVPA